MAVDEDACAICEGDRSIKKNPIIFCDGEDCNIPVHKECYGVDKVPDGEWFCQRCENKHMKKPTRVLCCPMQTGAFKHTVIPGDFMHVVCARWNKSIDHAVEPYAVNKSEINAFECYCCSKKQGICIKCEEPSCTRRFHVTCAINSGLITVGKTIPSDYSPRCSEHQPESNVEERVRRRVQATSTRRRRLMKKDVIESSSEDEEEEEEEEEEQDDLMDEDGSEAEPEEPMEEDHDDDIGPSKKKANRKAKGKTNSAPAKRRATAAHATKNSGPIKLFLSDQSDSDDNMGSSDKKTEEAPPLSMRDRLEAKRKKSEAQAQTRMNNPTANRSLSLDINRPSNTPSTAQTPTTPHKQKLPNKTHLAPPRPPTTHTTSSPANLPNGGPKRQYSNPTPQQGTVIKDLDELRNDIIAGAQQRSSFSAQSQHPIPYTNVTPGPYDAPGNGMMYPGRNIQPDRKMFGGPRRSLEGPSDVLEYQKTMMRAKLTEIMDELFSSQKMALPAPVLEQRLHAANQEIIRLKEEAQRFKRAVTDVFEGLNVPVPSGQRVTIDKVEDYINELRSMLIRTGPVRDQDQRKITEYVQDMIIDEQHGQN